MNNKYELVITQLKKNNNEIDSIYKLDYHFKNINEVCEIIQKINSEFQHNYHYFYFEIKEIN